MTTYEGVPSVTTYLTMMLTNRISRAKAKERTQINGNRMPAILQTIVRLVLHLAGFSALTFAGYTWNMTAGLIVGGLSCFVLAWLLNSPSNAVGPSAGTQAHVDPMASRR
jgi:fatty-acid desaturase